MLGTKVGERHPLEPADTARMVTGIYAEGLEHGFAEHISRRQYPMRRLVKISRA